MHPLLIIILFAAQLNYVLAAPLPATIGGSNIPCSYPDSPGLVPADGQPNTKLVSLDATGTDPCPVQEINVNVGPNPILPAISGAMAMQILHNMLGMRKSAQAAGPPGGVPLSFATLDAVEKLHPDLIPDLPVAHLSSLTAASARGLRSDYLQALSAKGLNAIQTDAAGGIPLGVMRDLEAGIANNGSPINRSVTQLVESEGVGKLQPWLADVVKRYLPHLLEP